MFKQTTKKKKKKKKKNINKLFLFLIINNQKMPLLKWKSLLQKNYLICKL